MMSSRIEIPHSEDEARKVINLFNDNAHNLSFQDAFSHAIDILYKGDFEIKKDPGGRMYFRCLNCIKDMNNLKSLSEHANSGSHFKNVDLNPKIPVQRRGKDIFKRIYERHSLQEKLSLTTIEIVGLERVEAFHCYGRKYYKCMTCGAHGSVDSMYRHLLGDKHTNKYINSKIELKDSDLTPEERNHFRKLLKSEVSCIKTIYDPIFYPYLWESEGKKRFSKKPAKLENVSSYEVDQVVPEEILIEDSQSVGEQKNDPENTFKHLTDKFKFIILSHGEETKLETAEDLKLAIVILSFALHWLHFANYAFILEKKTKGHDKQFQQQKGILESCMGYVHRCFQTEFNSKYPDLALNLND